jgi:hypothetical protein
MPKVQAIRRETNADQADTLKGQNKPDRSGTRCVSAHLPEDMYWKLKELAVSQRVEMQTIIAQAANALFERHGMKPMPVTSHGANGKAPVVVHQR